MKFLFLIFLFFFLHNCSKPKTVLICGDHVCINKSEAEQYFEENLSLEVKIINKKSKNNIDLVELNLKKDKSGEKKITLLNKKDTSEELKILTKKEKSKIKKSIRKKRKENKITKKSTSKSKGKIDLKVKNNNKKIKSLNEETIEKNIKKKNINESGIQVVDVCTILKKCSIEEISKFLLEQGKKKKFPDITIRQ
tara:strand:- start:316 stop:900 length:585 start_codon:yes stop_codon:yes gene_type:complete